MTLLSYPDIIRKTKSEKNITNGRLAEHSGVNETLLSRAERGICIPPKEKFLRPMAELLEIDPDLLVLSAGRFPEHWRLKMVKHKNLRKTIQLLMSLKAPNFVKARNYVESLAQENDSEA